MLTNVITTASTLDGVRGQPVSVEVQLSNGMPSFTIVGLPDAACRESRDRVRAAVLSAGLDWPSRRLTVNLAPSELRKGGSVLDLAIAVGILAVTEQVSADAVEGRAFLGELGLDGGVRAVRGIVPLAHCLDGADLVAPLTDLALLEQLPRRGSVRGAASLNEVVSALEGGDWPAVRPSVVRAPGEPAADLADVIGHPQGRLACEVAAAGGHHLLLLGPPGAGKTMLANRVGGLLPDLCDRDAVEASLVHSAAGSSLAGGLLRRPPVRAPHHSSSMASLVGGGSAGARPGEASLAHRGVLFLDEMGEFAPSALEALRQPLEEGVVRISRVRGAEEFPARFLLVAAMNPCPCGEAGRPGRCRCSDAARNRYARRLSGPLLDRFDLRVMVPRPPAATLLGRASGEGSASIGERVASARARAVERGVRCNAELGPNALADCARTTGEGEALLRQQLENGHLTGRGLDRVKAIGLTLADLVGDDPVLDADRLTLALSLRVDANRLLAAVGS